MRNKKYGLPKSVNLGEEEYEIRTDYSVILDIFEVLNDAELTNAEKCQCVILIFYVDYEKIPTFLYEEAIKQCFAFIDGGERKNAQKMPKLMDWEQDFPLIVSAVNRVIGEDIRTIDYDPQENKGGLHWYTFKSAFQEIGGDCLFSQVINIRDKQARGKKLEKYEKEWLNRNRAIVELKQKYTEAENDLAKLWMSGGKKNG